MSSRSLASAVALAVLLAAPAAWADRIALLPSRGSDAGPRGALDADLVKGLAALGHTIVPATEISAAMAKHVTDGVADTQEEYRAVGDATRADWVLVGAIEPAVTTEHVELTACLVKSGRVESVAREVEKAREQPQVQEMLVVLVRPEGIGAGALPWERLNPAAPAPPPPPPAPAPPPAAPTPPPPPPPPAVPPVDGRAHVGYPLGTPGDVWPPYSGGKRAFLGANLGFSLPAVRPGPGAGIVAPSKRPLGTSLVGAVRGGYAAGDLGLEPFAELGGNLVGPRALWLAAGARWMFAPALSRGADGVLAGSPFYLGPEVLVGGLFELGSTAIDSKSLGNYSASGSSHFLLGVGLDLAYALSPSFQLEAGLGNLRWAPGGGGSLLTLGATLGASVRF